jgi:HCOMODA/2-hydroxy-3-carboxy-muconic semialdehyde decarboxylase
MQSTGRRQFLWGAAALAATGASRGEQARMTRPGDKERTAQFDDLVVANHILAAQNIVDGFGHISLRTAPGSNHFYLSRSLAPAQVTAADIMEFDFDGVPQNNDTRAPYLERFIHAEVFRARPEIMSVIHCHTASLIPFGITKIPLRPVYHNSSFVGEGIPVWEIRDAGGVTDMLVSNTNLGKSLAATLADKPAALLRGHGAVVVGKAIPDAVARSIYLDVNARIQAQAMAMGAPIDYLSPEEVAKRAQADEYDRPWQQWKRHVMAK